MWKYISDIRESENCIDPNLKMVGKTGPRQLFLSVEAGNYSKLPLTKHPLATEIICFGWVIFHQSHEN